MDLRTQSRKRPPEDSNTSTMDLRKQSMRDARGIKQAKSDALKEAFLSSPVENPISHPTTPPNDSAAGRSKSAESTNISNRWLELYKERDGPERPAKLTEREAARYVSSVGGQGIVSCNCRSDCTKQSCSCKKAKRLCSSRCHRNNNKCKNKHDDDVDCGK